MALQKELIAQARKTAPVEVPEEEINPELFEAVNNLVKNRIHEISSVVTRKHGTAALRNSSMRRGSSGRAFPGI